MFTTVYLIKNKCTTVPVCIKKEVETLRFELLLLKTKVSKLLLVELGALYMIAIIFILHFGYYIWTDTGTDIYLKSCKLYSNTIIMRSTSSSK